MNKMSDCEANGSTEGCSSPALPPGKLYHVFFSHCAEDRDWVLEVVNRLESPEYGFKCCFADRDFELGVPVFQNITKCIHSSKRTVVVLSPDFLKSGWCSYETRITLELDLDTKQRLLIPVMLRSCRVPEYIGKLTFMEVHNEHFWERFVAAIKENDPRSFAVLDGVGDRAVMNSASPFEFNPYFCNTDEIVEVTVYTDCDCCPTSAADYIPNELMRRGIQITPQEYRDIVTSADSLLFVKCHCCFNKVLYLLPVTLVLIFGSFYTFLFRALGLIEGSIIFSAGCLTLVIILLVMWNACNLKAIHSISKALEAANRIARKRNLMVFLKDYGCCRCAMNQVSMIFCYYDWRPCLNHLINCLVQEGESRDEVSSSEVRDTLTRNIQVENDRSNIEEIAWDLLLKHAGEYCYLLVNRRMAIPSEQRHTRQRECLCQFVESIVLTGRKSCLDCIFRIKSRHPWKRCWSMY